MIVLTCWCMLSYILIVNGDEDALFFYIDSPKKLSYSYQIQPSYRLGGRFPAVPRKEVQLIYSYPAHACTPLRNRFTYNKVVLVERGECSFYEKAVNVEEAGAMAMIVTDSARGDHESVEMIPDASGSTVDIPVAYLIGVSGKQLRDFLLYNDENVYVTIPLNHTLIPLQYIPKKPPWELW